jgi:Domain of unknown function DUF302
MQTCQRAGIDLPLKALVWEDGDGTVWLSCNDPAWIARRHALGPQIEPAVHAMSAMLAAIALKGTGADPASQNDRNCKDSPAINAAYSVLKGVNNMHFGLDLPRVGNRMAKAFRLFADPRITVQSQSLRQSIVLPPSQIEI